MRAPNRWAAAFQRIEWLSPRRFGSVDEVLDYARAESARVGNGARRVDVSNDQLCCEIVDALRISAGTATVKRVGACSLWPAARER
jgi:hypothetical protein